MHNNIDTFNPLDVLAAAAALQSATVDGEVVDESNAGSVTRSCNSNSENTPQVKRSHSFIAGNNDHEPPSRSHIHRTRTRSNNESQVWFNRRSSYDKFSDLSNNDHSCYLDHSYANFVAPQIVNDKKYDLNGDDPSDEEIRETEVVIKRDGASLHKSIVECVKSDESRVISQIVEGDGLVSHNSNTVDTSFVAVFTIDNEEVDKKVTLKDDVDSFPLDNSQCVDSNCSRDVVDENDQFHTSVVTTNIESADHMVMVLKEIDSLNNCPLVNCISPSSSSFPPVDENDVHTGSKQIVDNNIVTVQEALNGYTEHDMCNFGNSAAAHDLKDDNEQSKISAETNQCQLSKLKTCQESVNVVNDSEITENPSIKTTATEQSEVDSKTCSSVGNSPNNWTSSIGLDVTDSIDKSSNDDEITVAKDTCSNCAENVEDLDKCLASSSDSFVNDFKDQAQEVEHEEPKPPDGNDERADLPSSDISVRDDIPSSLETVTDQLATIDDLSDGSPSDIVNNSDLPKCDVAKSESNISLADQTKSVSSVARSSAVAVSCVSNVTKPTANIAVTVNDNKKAESSRATSSSLNVASSGIIMNNIVSPVRTHPIIRALPTSPINSRMLGVIPGQRPMIAVPVIAVPVNKNIPSAGTILTPRLTGQTFNSVNQNSMGTILVPTSSAVQNPVVNPARRTNLFKGAQSSALGFAGSFQLVTGNVGSTPLTTLNGGIIDDLSGAGKMINSTAECQKQTGDDNGEIIDVVSPAEASSKPSFSSPNKYNCYRLSQSAPESPLTPVPISSVQTTPTESSANVSPEVQSNKTSELAELIQASVTATPVSTLNKSPLIKPVPQIVQTFTGIPTNVSMHQWNQNGISSLYQSELAQQLLRTQNRPVGRPPKERSKYKVSSSRSRIEGVRPLSHHAATQIHENLRPHPLRDHDYCLHSFYQVVAFTKQEEKREIKEEKEQKKLEEKQEKKKKKEQLRLKKMRESESSKSRKYKKRVDQNKKKKKKLSIDSSETSDFSPEKLIKSEPRDIVNFELGGELKFDNIDTSSEMAASDSIKSEPSSPGSFYGKEGRSLRRKDQQSLRMRNDDRVKITGTSSFQNQFVFYATKKPRRRARPDVDTYQSKGLRPSSSAEYLPGLDATYLEAKAKFVAAQQKKEESLINPPKYPGSSAYLGTEHDLHDDDVFSSIPTSSGNTGDHLAPEIDHLDLAPEFNPSIPKGKLAVGVTEEESNFLETLCSDVPGHEQNHSAADLSQELDSMGFNLTPDQVKEFLATFGVEKAAKLLTGDPDFKITSDHHITEETVPEVVQDTVTTTGQNGDNIIHDKPPMLSGMSTNSNVLLMDSVVTSTPVPTTDVTHSLPSNNESKDVLQQPSELGADLTHDNTPHDLFDLDTSDLFSECVNINSILNFQSPEKAVHSSQGSSSITKARKLDFEGLDESGKPQVDIAGAGDASNSTKFSKSESVSSTLPDPTRSTAIYNHPQGNNFSIGKPESMFKSQFMKKLVSDAPEVTDPGVPDLIMVNMFWNDLPGLFIRDNEYVRLVDIHKQVLPAKPTGLLKNRCRALNLEFTNCTELQRDFLIRYAHAAPSRSTLIVTKDVAQILIGYYVNPPPRASRSDIKEEPDEVIDSDDEMSIPASSITSNEDISKNKRKRGGTLARWQRRRKQQRLARQRKNAKRRPATKKPIKLVVNLKEAMAAIKRNPSSPKPGDYLGSSDSDMNTASSTDSDDTTDRLEQIRKLRNRAKYLRSEILKVGRGQRNNNKTKDTEKNVSSNKPGMGCLATVDDKSVSKDVIRIKATKLLPVTRVVSISGNNGKSPMKLAAKGVKIDDSKKPGLAVVKPSLLSANSSNSKIITVSKPSLSMIPIISDQRIKTDEKCCVEKIRENVSNTAENIQNNESNALRLTNDISSNDRNGSGSSEDEVVLLKEEPCSSSSGCKPVETDETVNKTRVQTPVNICQTLQQASVDEIEVIELSDEYSSPKKCAPSSPVNKKTVVVDKSRILTVEHYDNPSSENGRQSRGCSQIGELCLDLYGTKTAPCLKCVVCNKFFSVYDFLEHLHRGDVSQQLIDVLVPQKLRLLNKKPTLQDIKHWKEFQIQQKKFSGLSMTPRKSADSVKSIKFDDSKDTSIVRDRANSTGSLNGAGTRQSKRARKPKQLFSFEKYVFPEASSSTLKSPEDENFIDDIDESLLKLVENVNNNSVMKCKKSDEVFNDNEHKFKKPEITKSELTKTVNSMRRRSDGQTVGSHPDKRHARSKSSPELNDASPAKKRRLETSLLSHRTSSRRASLVKTRYKR